MTAVVAMALAGCAGGTSTPGGGGQHGVAASCVGPTLTVSPASAAAGDTVHVTGKWFAADCYDTGQQGTPPPLTGLTVEVSQSGTSWPVARGVDAIGETDVLDLSVRLPEDLRAGPAVVRVVGYGSPADIVVTRG